MLFDTASLYFRAFFGLPDSMRNPAGEPCNAVRGLADFLARLIDQYQPTHAVCCWDVDWRPGWRVALVPTYKTHRLADPADASVAPRALGPTSIVPIEGYDLGGEEVPDPLESQLPAILTMLQTANIAVWGADHFEADDVIATCAANFPGHVFVVTGDRDLFQLADERVEVLYTAKGVAKHERITSAVVEEKYGITGAQYADFATLRGDASDGLVGVPGVGEKTAASLVRSFGSLEGIAVAVADPASSISPGLRKKLESAAHVFTHASQVVKVVPDITMDVNFDQAKLCPLDNPRWDDVAEHLGLGGAAGRLRDALARSV